MGERQVTATLLSLDRTIYPLGEQVTFEHKIQNTGKDPVIVPWTPNLGDLEPIDPNASYEYRVGVVVLTFAGLLFGLVPAISSSKLDVYSMLKEGSGRSSSNRQGSRLRSAFVVGEIALAVVILVCSALLAKSFLGLVRSNPGFSA